MPSKKNVDSSPDIRILRDQLDHLYKENEKKDARADNLSRELVAMRTSFSNQQRELRLLSNSFDRIKSENEQLGNQLAKSNQLNDVLKHLPSSGKSIKELSKLLSSTKLDHNAMLNELEQKNGIIAEKDNKIAAIERELEIAHRAINIQNKAEMGGNLSNSKEIMRSLYFDLGKKQTDLHNITLELADNNKLVKALKEELKSSADIVSTLTKDKEKLKDNIAELNQQTIQFADTVSSLQQTVNAKKQLCASLTSQCEDLAARLREERKAHATTNAENEAKISQMSDLIPILENEKSQLRARFDHQKEALTHYETLSQLNEQKLSESMSRVSALETQNDMLRKSLYESLTVKDEQGELIEKLRGDVNSLESQIRHLEQQQEESGERLKDCKRELSEAHSKTAGVVKERDEALVALQKTMQIMRQATTKVQLEREKCQSIELQFENLKRSKEQVSKTVLDALQREKSKNSVLTAALEAVPLEFRYKDMMLQTSLEQGRSRSSDSSSSSSSRSSSNIEVAASMRPPHPPVGVAGGTGAALRGGTSHGLIGSIQNMSTSSSIIAASDDQHSQDMSYNRTKDFFQ